MSDSAEFHYIRGIDATGDFEGTCESTGYRVRAGSDGALVVAAEQASLSIYRTYVNSTVIGSPGLPQLETPATHEQRIETIPLSQGEILLRWHAKSHLYLELGHPDEARKLTADLKGSQLYAGEVLRSLGAGPGVRYVELNGNLWRVETGIGGPARWVETDQDAFFIEGDGHFILTDVQLSASGIEVELPPYPVFQALDETPISHTAAFLYTEGRLDVRGLRMEVSRGTGDLACAGLAWSGVGAATFRAATGAAWHGDEEHAFEHREFTINGVFTSQEQALVAAVPWGEEVRVNAMLVGTFASGADYEVMGGQAGVPLMLVAQATIAALALSALVALWRVAPILLGLFTRVPRDKALDHPVRSLLERAARERPATTLAEVVRATGHSYSTVRHHTTILERLEYLRTIRFSREVYLFPRGTPRERARREVALRSMHLRYLVEYLGSDGRSLRETRATLQERFRRSPAWATRLVAAAVKSGLVARERNDEGVKLCAVGG